MQKPVHVCRAREREDIGKTVADASDMTLTIVFCVCVCALALLRMHDGTSGWAVRMIDTNYMLPPPSRHLP